MRAAMLEVVIDWSFAPLMSSRCHHCHVHQVLLQKNPWWFDAILVSGINLGVPKTGYNKLCRRLPQYAPAPASWPLNFWPWKWCPSHVWRGLPLCHF